MTANKKYYRDVKKLFPVYLKKKNYILSSLKNKLMNMKIHRMRN